MQVVRGKIEVGAEGVRRTFPPLSHQTMKEFEMTIGNIPQDAKTIKICNIGDCRKPAAKRYNSCSMHIARKARHGDPNIVLRDHGQGVTREDRFWSMVAKSDPDDCWLWISTVDPQGYGNFQCKSLGISKAHQYAWFLHTQRLPRRGTQLLHSCDTPKCVNPSHLREGTQKENMRDKFDRNRQAKGLTHGMAKLNDVAVVEIRTVFADVPSSLVAKYFGCTATTISFIKRGGVWKHIEPPVAIKLNPQGRRNIWACGCGVIIHRPHIMCEDCENKRGNVCPCGRKARYPLSTCEHCTEKQNDKHGKAL